MNFLLLSRCWTADYCLSTRYMSGIIQISDKWNWIIHKGKYHLSLTFLFSYRAIWTCTYLRSKWLIFLTLVHRSPSGGCWSALRWALITDHHLSVLTSPSLLANLSHASLWALQAVAWIAVFQLQTLPSAWLFRQRFLAPSPKLSAPTRCSFTQTRSASQLWSEAPCRSSWGSLRTRAWCPSNTTTGSVARWTFARREWSLDLSQTHSPWRRKVTVRNYMWPSISQVVAMRPF